MKIRLLICEQDEDLREGHVSYFSRATDFEVKWASSVEDCRSKIESFRPDALLLEPESPCAKYCSKLDTNELPVLVLSRFSRCDEVKCRANVHDYHVKPKSLLEIEASIRRIVDSNLESEVDKRR